MADQGVFAVHRGIFDHPIFAPEPFTEREAWLWLLSAAAWTDKRIRAGHSMIELKRGQLAFATRFLATKWKWAHSRVVRFLRRLETDTMIGTLPTHNTTLITICNYNKYAFGRNADETQNETPTGTRSERARNKEEEPKKVIKEESKKEAREVALVSDDWPDFFESIFWCAWPNKVGKPAALKALAACRRRGCSFVAIMAGIDSYIRDKPPDRPWLNPATFLNQNRWEDQPAKTSPADGKPPSKIIQAADDLRRKIASFDGPASGDIGIRDGQSPAPPRLLSHG